jgi:hypothetical protein
VCFRYNTATTFYFCELHIIVIDLDKKSFIFLPTILLDNLEILIKQQYVTSTLRLVYFRSSVASVISGLHM